MDVPGRTGRSVEETLGTLAGASHGVVTRRQLLVAGLSRTEIEGRLLKGALLAEHPGVYRVGHRARSVEATYLAAVWACGVGSLLRGAAAGHLLMLVRGTPPPPEVVSSKERRIKGVRTVRSRQLDARDGMVWRGIPVTTVPATIVDLAAALPLDALARACHEAGVRYRTTPADVEAVVARRPRHPGAANLRKVLRGEERVTLSKLERRFLALLREEGLPLPKTNHPAGGRYVDCRWPEHHLTVELDSYRYHASRHAWENDRRREREAYARGDQFRRYTYGDIFDYPSLMLAELRSLIAATRPA